MMVGWWPPRAWWCHRLSDSFEDFVCDLIDLEKGEKKGSKIFIVTPPKTNMDTQNDAMFEAGDAFFENVRFGIK